jgi:DNA-binding response OmpR family regulator
MFRKNDPRIFFTVSSSLTGVKGYPKMKKILIIDDDWAIRMLYSEELLDEGYATVTCGADEEYMAVIQRENPDLVVLDVRLEENNGLDLLQDIRNLYYDLPVVLCTVYEDSKDDLRAIAADYCVIKESDLGELKLRIKMALETEMNAEV